MYFRNIHGLFQKKDKSSRSITKALEMIISERKPNHLQTDRGKECYNKDFKELMKLNEINHYSTYSEKKASVCERFNGTLKDKVWKQFTIQGKYKWVDILPNLLNQYNNSVHRTTGMKPVDVNKKNERLLLNTVYK
jgi:hypothetical protein